MVAFDIVDYLYDRPVIIGQTIQNHRVALLDDREPLPVGVHFRRESLEYRMFRIRKNAQGSWRNLLLVVLAYGLEHAIVPVIGLEESTHGIRCGII